MEYSHASRTTIVRHLGPSVNPAPPRRSSPKRPGAPAPGRRRLSVRPLKYRARSSSGRGLRPVRARSRATLREHRQLEVGQRPLAARCDDSCRVVVPRAVFLAKRGWRNCIVEDNHVLDCIKCLRCYWSIAAPFLRRNSPTLAPLSPRNTKGWVVRLVFLVAGVGLNRRPLGYEIVNGRVANPLIS